MYYVFITPKLHSCDTIIIILILIVRGDKCRSDIRNENNNIIQTYIVTGRIETSKLAHHTSKSQRDIILYNLTPVLYKNV